jgi:SAM-dependent methyltransferase
MSGVANEAMENEFGVLATWTADAVRVLGPDYAIPAACRGSASPAALEWLGRECRLDKGMVLADVGGGMGGPAAFAESRFGVRPIVLEPMAAACRAAAELFATPALACDGAALPLADASADAVWCLGVLCTTSDKNGLVAEIARVLKPGGRLGLLAFTSDEPRPAGAPEGNEFPSESDLPVLLGKHGLEVTTTIAADTLTDREDGRWRQLAEETEALVGQLHAGDPRLAEAQEQERRIGQLLKSDVVRGTLLSAYLT